MSELKAIRSGEIYNIIEYEDCFRTDDLYYPKSEGGEVKRKEQMGWYIERICKVLQHLPVTQANEIECKALWANIECSHPDIAEEYK